jgi:hypothetical protein
MPSRQSSFATDALGECHEACRRGLEALVPVPPSVTVRDPRQRESEMRSPFVAAAVCETFCAAADLSTPEVRAGAADLAGYLVGTRETDGSWCFEPEGRPCPPDADTTACAAAALARTGSVVAQGIMTRIIESQCDAGGLIRPWLLWYAAAAERLDGNAGDAIVTSNVLLAASRSGLNITWLLGALQDHVRERGLSGLATVYYDSLAVRSYYLARAVAPISTEGSLAHILRRFLSDLDPAGLNVVDLAAGVAAAAQLGVESTSRRLLPELLALQDSEGAWPGSRWFVDAADNVWRSAAFSTALAIEALALARSKGFVDR